MLSLSVAVQGRRGLTDSLKTASTTHTLCKRNYDLLSRFMFFKFLMESSLIVWLFCVEFLEVL